MDAALLLTRVAAWTGVGLAGLSLGFTRVRWHREDAATRAKATVDFWISTMDVRFRLRGALPYEHATEFRALANRLAAAYVENGGQPELPGPDAEQDNLLRQYLSLFESLGAGVNKGTFDFDVIGRIDGPRIVALWRATGAYVTARREAFGNPYMYQEFTEFAARLDTEQPWRHGSGV